MNNKIQSLLTILLVTSTTIALSAQANAQTATNAAEVDSETIKQNIQDRIKKAVQSNNQTESSQRYGWTGTITNLTSQSMDLIVNGETKHVSLNANTTITSKGKTVDIEDLEIDKFVIVVGQVDNNDLLTAEQIISIDSLPTKSGKVSLIATVGQIDSRKKTVTILPLGKTEELVITSGKATKYSQVGLTTAVTFTDITEQDLVLVIYEADSKDPETLIMNRFHILKPAQPSAEKTASPSPSASPKLTPKATPKTSPQTEL